ncbi:hypothetical protein [Pseudodesulfovibrio pelocollis]|uniref:hypothetical protein n=1 Tax=Pseudodesulfovibrio pelocollis TaxID=3051432 RepID=UPI00255AB704|nr:hypothetical protein [Pseudodesulfovibrio sp. SB368]
MDDVRVYGDFHRVSPELFERIKDALPFDQVEYDGDVLRLDHEGVYLMIDDFLELMRDLLPEGGYGHVEYIDNLEWVVIRYTITPGRIDEKRVLVDNVLDAHMRDHGM